MSCTVNRRLVVFAKIIDSCQPAQVAQADMGRRFSQSLNFLHFIGLFYTMIKPVVLQNGFYGFKIRLSLAKLSRPIMHYKITISPLLRIEN